MFGNNPFDGPFGGFGGRRMPQRFDECYRCYPVSFVDKAHLEDGDKILLPPSALETLARLDIEYPMLFKLENEMTGRVSHCGVLEFSAPEGQCYMPYWMMQNLFLSEGSMLRIQNVTLPKATFVKIRPQTSAFSTNISNPRAVLEASFRKYSCMTVGDTIYLSYNDQSYFLDVREVQPADAACIIETDCEVDFEPPADFVPPPVPVAAGGASSGPPAAPLAYGGVPTVAPGESGKALGYRGGLRLSGGLKQKQTSGQETSNNSGSSSSSTDMASLRAIRMKKYEAFHGTGQSMSGKVETTTGASTLLSKKKLSMTSSSSLGSSKTTKEDKETAGAEPDEQEKKGNFKAFQGEGCRLR